MKEYSFNIDQRQVRQLFSPIREKRDVVRLLMRIIKLMLVNSSPRANEVKGEVVLHVSKMSRLFFFSDFRYFSVCFPFSVREGMDTFEFSLGGVVDVDSKITSDVLSFIDSDANFNINCAYQFIEPVLDISRYEPNFWTLLLKLLTLDDGYIRYDYDEENEQGLIHPKNHYDVFYSSNSTFKVGLKGKLKKEEMIDFVKLESDCHFLEEPNRFMRWF